MRKLQLIISATMLFAVSETFAQSTYEAILKGKSCSERRGQQIDCDYKIGNDFWLSIAGVGQPDAGVSFMKADFDGKYYGTYGVMHGCAIVKTGKANNNKTKDPLNFAFVSPKNGKVYRDWESCRAGS
jgi:hypothetical protein